MNCRLIHDKVYLSSNLIHYWVSLFICLIHNIVQVSKIQLYLTNDKVNITSLILEEFELLFKLRLNDFFRFALFVACGLTQTDGHKCVPFVRDLAGDSVGGQVDFSALDNKNNGLAISLTYIWELFQNKNVKIYI